MQNKLDELHVQCVTLDADFIFVTEVLPKYNPDNISCASMIYHIDGYKAFHSSDNGRGVIIYAKDTYNISPNQYLNSLYHDATWCDWTVDHKTIILGCIYRTAKTRSDRDFEMSLCYTPKAFSCLEEIKDYCLELAPSFPKMYNITMF